VSVLEVAELDVGFDTASSIALLAVSALAKRDAKGQGISSASIVILPVSFPFILASGSKERRLTCVQLLFTAGMSLVDSLDSVLML
jgi:nickel/cobalt transporter (NiCoT) family protein